MNTAYPGSFVLSGRAFVENARQVPGKPRTLVLDVYFWGVPAHEENEIACSLRFFKGDDALVIPDSLYDVVATVTLFFSRSLRMLMMSSL